MNLRLINLCYWGGDFVSNKEERAYKRLIFYFTSRLLFMILAIIFISYGCSLLVNADSSVDFVPEYSNGSISNESYVNFSDLFLDEDFHWLSISSVESYYKSLGFTDGDWNYINSEIWYK